MISFEITIHYKDFPINAIRDPLAYAREKLGSGIFWNQMFSIEVTKGIRILYSVDSKTA